MSQLDYLQELQEYLGEQAAEILFFLNDHDYSWKALYIAQECLIDLLLNLQEGKRYFTYLARRLRSRAATIAKQYKASSAGIPEDAKARLSCMYERSKLYDRGIRDLAYYLWLLRYIGDGIAWHSFGFDRHFIKTLGSTSQVSLPDASTIEKHRRVFRAIRRASGRAYLPVMNDITNCLRTGDISIVGVNSIQTLELKIRQSVNRGSEDRLLGEARSEREKRQKERGKKINQFLASGNMDDLYPSLKGGIVYRSQVVQWHNFRFVKDAIKDARTTGYAVVQPETGLLYLVLDLNKSTQEEALVYATTEFPEFFQSLITFRSISPRMDQYHDSFPITAMELPPEDIVDILSGSIGVVVLLNYEQLEEACRERGIPLVVTHPDEGHTQITVEREPRLTIGQGMFDRLLLEALSIDTLVRLIEEIQVDNRWEEQLSDVDDSSS